jgi:hypothetical protein
MASRKQTYTHTGTLSGRGSYETRRGVLLRRGKVHWITSQGDRYHLRTGWAPYNGFMPTWSLDLDSVVELDEPVRR